MNEWLTEWIKTENWLQTLVQASVVQLDSLFMVASQIPPKLRGWKQSIFILSHFLRVTNLREAPLGGCGSRWPFTRLWSRCWPGCTHRTAALAWRNCFQDGALTWLLPGDLSSSPIKLNVFMIWQPASPRVSDPRNSKSQHRYDLSLEVTYHCFYLICGPHPHLMRRTGPLVKGCGYQWVEAMKAYDFLKCL